MFFGLLKIQEINVEVQKCNYNDSIESLTFQNNLIIILSGIFIFLDSDFVSLLSANSFNFL